MGLNWNDMVEVISYFSQKTDKHTPQFLAGKIQWTIDTVQSNQICIELSMLLKSYWHDSPSPTKSCEFSYMHIVYYMMTDLHVYMYTFWYRIFLTLLQFWFYNKVWRHTLHVSQNKTKSNQQLAACGGIFFHQIKPEWTGLEPSLSYSYHSKIFPPENSS